MPWMDPWFDAIQLLRQLTGGLKVYNSDDRRLKPEYSPISPETSFWIPLQKIRLSPVVSGEYQNK